MKATPLAEYRDTDVVQASERTNVGLNRRFGL
jgi:hypothetical protein